jgi:hypothetical protein
MAVPDNGILAMSNIVIVSSNRAITPAIISHQQLGALLDILRDFEQRRDTAMILPIRGTIGQTPFVIDLRLCPIALAEISTCFDHDPAVIRIADEAQFEQLLVTVSQAYKTGDVVMTLSSRPDVVLPPHSVQRSFQTE